MRYLITKMKDGSIVDFGFITDSDPAPDFIEQGFQRSTHNKAITVDRTDGTRIRYER